MCQPIQNSQAEDVESVMVDDHWLMPDGRVLTIDEDDVVTRARRRSAAGCGGTSWSAIRTYRRPYPDDALSRAGRPRW